MSTKGAPRITDAKKSEDFTKISFKPDLEKFNLGEHGLAGDMDALLSKRVYDMAGTLRDVKVYLNGERIKVNGFKKYVDMYTSGINEVRPCLSMYAPSGSEPCECSCRRMVRPIPRRPSARRPASRRSSTNAAASAGRWLSTLPTANSSNAPSSTRSRRRRAAPTSTTSSSSSSTRSSRRRRRRMQSSRSSHSRSRTTSGSLSTASSRIPRSTRKPRRT